VAEVVRDLDDLFELFFLEPEFGGDKDRDRVFNCLVEDHVLFVMVVVGLLLPSIMTRRFSFVMN